MGKKKERKETARHILEISRRDAEVGEAHDAAQSALAALALVLALQVLDIGSSEIAGQDGFGEMEVPEPV